MCPFLALVLLASLVYGQSTNFTINSVGLLATPSQTLKNGNELELRCKVDIAMTTNFELTKTFSFYKDDNEIYNVTTIKSEAVYHIPKARVSTSGIYRCKVNADKREKGSEEIQIKVTGLSPPTLILSKTEVTEGDDIIVRCQAPEEEPPMKFGFYKFLGQVKEGPKLRTSALNFAEATFKIKEGEDFLHFECDVELVSVIEPKSGFSKRQTVTVVAPFGTPTITVRPSNNITEGTKMEVTCTVRTSHIVPQDVTLTLQKGSHILNSATTGTLTHSQVASETDTGNYTCKVEGTKASKSNSALIKVQELFPKPVLAIRRTINAPYIMEDEQLLLECSVSSLLQEEAQKQEFYLNHITRRQREKGGRFHMKVRGSDSGLYNCEVTIANITKRSNPVSLTVYAPVSKPILQHVVERKKMVVLGDTLTLTCRSPTGTPPISYTLYQGSQQLGTVEVNNYSEATFRVNVSKQHDSGQYQCHARNRNSKASLFSDVVNITAIVPVADVKLIIIPSNGEVEEGAELSLVCSVIHGTLPINFQFYVKKDIDIMLLNVTETEQLHAKYQVQSFTKQKEGNYFCTASNQANKSDHSKVKEVKAVLASWKKAVIGAFVFLIIVAAIGIIVYLYLDKKKKGKNISTDTSRTTKIVSSTNESAAVEMKGDDVYFGSVQNEDELHILKAAEDTIDNSQQNHDTAYTEADGPTPDTHQDPAENNISRVEENPQELNNLS